MPPVGRAGRRSVAGASVAVALVAILVPALATACARSLPEPVPLPELAPDLSDGPVPSAADALRAYDARDLEGVRLAAAMWERRIALTTEPAVRFEAVIGSIRALLWLAEHEPDAGARRSAAGAAVRSAQWCALLEPEAAQCGFWLGASLGSQARERRSTALDALPRIVALFEEARRAIPRFDSGGPDRALALLYARAPGFPVGPGDPELALDHAHRAVAIAEAYPPNLMALAECRAGLEGDAAAEADWRRALASARIAERAGEPDAMRWIREIRAALGDP